MAQPFALTLARPERATSPGPVVVYDEQRQLNILAAGGAPAVAGAVPTPWAWTASKSRAGSKTHRDDTDDVDGLAAA